MAMGRHVSQQPMVLSTYAGSGFFDHGLHRLAELLPRLPAEQVNALPVAINALPVAPPLHEVLKSELTFGNKLAAPDGIPPEAIEPLATFYGDITRSKATSRDAFKKILEAAVAKLPESERVMAADEGMVESGQRLWDLSARSEARKAMLYTAVQIVTRGEAAVAESSDPFGGKPFGFRRTPDGFILTSALTSGHPKNPVTSDKAIELVVGKSAAQ
jgi:hypothetical protein